MRNYPVKARPIGSDEVLIVDTQDADKCKLATLSTIPSFVVTANKTASYTIGTDDAAEAYGGVIYVTGAAVITAPNIAAGMNFTIITSGNVEVSVALDVGDRMYLDGVLLAIDKGATNTSTNQDMITFTYFSAGVWHAISGSPDGDSWTAEV